MVQQVNNKTMHKIYTTIKQVSATEMSSVEAMAKGYRVNEDSLQIEGYEVIYEDGYKSWCPKEIFNKNSIVSAPEYAYNFFCPNDAPDYLKRMFKEFEDLRVNYVKLQIFISGDKYNTLEPYEKHMLNLQHKFMDGYMNILGKRIYLELEKNKVAKEA